MIDQAFTQPGFQPPAMTLIRDGDEQTRRLGCCDVGGEAHGGPHGGPRGNYWAPGILGMDCFIHLGDAGQDISGSVHVDMRLVQDARVPLSEPLTIQGTTERTEEFAKGRMLFQVFRFGSGNGRTPIRCKIGVLVPNPEKMTGGRKPGAPPVDPRDGFLKKAERTLVPDDVTTYGGAGNPIHHDPAFAQSLGYRAPIAHGVMTAAWLLGALDNPYAPSTLDVRFTFNRPVFWDDLMELWVEEGAKPGAVRYRALNADGRMTAEMTVVDVSYD